MEFNFKDETASDLVLSDACLLHFKVLSFFKKKKNRDTGLVSSSIGCLTLWCSIG